MPGADFLYPVVRSTEPTHEATSGEPEEEVLKE